MSGKKPSYITVQEIADDLSVHPETVRRWIHAGTLRGIRFGTRFRVTRKEWARFQEQDSPEAVAR